MPDIVLLLLVPLLILSSINDIFGWKQFETMDDAFIRDPGFSTHQGGEIVNDNVYFWLAPIHNRKTCLSHNKPTKLATAYH